MGDHLVFMLQLVITGVAVGGVYSLIALGFVLIFKASSVVNFGPGELVLFGAYVSWATILAKYDAMIEELYAPPVSRATARSGTQ